LAFISNRFVRLHYFESGIVAPTSNRHQKVMSSNNKSSNKKARSGWHDRRQLDVPLRFCLVMMPVSLLYCYWNWKVGLFAFFFFAVYFIALECMSAPPANRPDYFITWARRRRSVGPRRPVLLCLGDSLTHGTMSSSYTPEIPLKLSSLLGMALPGANAPQPTFSDPLWVVNAGQNGLTSHVVLTERLQKAMGVFPDFVLILVGTNDVRGMYSTLWARELVSTHDLPEPPTLENYERNLRGILSFVRQSSPGTKIAVVTLPPMGEDLRSSVNEWVRRANGVIERVASASSDEENRIAVIPLYERLEARIEKKRRKWALPVEAAGPLIMLMNPLYHLFGIVFTWDRMSWIVGNAVLSDCIHLNDTARDILVDLICEWLLKVNVAKAIAVKR
jgi:lysophospholipase L1-like esterase